jgi:hypothetical protein
LEILKEEDCTEHEKEEKQNIGVPDSYQKKVDGCLADERPQSRHDGPREPL